MAKAGRGSDQFPLRLPEGLRDRIKGAAEKSGRSMNTEIISALEAAYPHPDETRNELTFADEIYDIQNRLERLRMAQADLDRAKSIAPDKVPKSVKQTDLGDD